MDTLHTYDVVLLPTLSQAVAYRKMAASRGNALFGVTVSSFDAWIGDAWELYGDGRAIVSRLQREALLRAACERVDGAVRGLDRVAASCVAEAAGLPAFEAAVAAVGCGETAGKGALAGISAAEMPVLSAVANYYAQLAELSLVEFGQALALLSQKGPARRLRVLLEEAAPLTALQETFFRIASWTELSVHTAAGDEGPVRAPDGVRVRFAFPSGQYAWPALLADIVREAVGEGCGRGVDEGANAGGSGTAAWAASEAPGALRAACSNDADAAGAGCADAIGGSEDVTPPGDIAARVVVTAKDPASLYGQVAPALSREGLSIALRGRRRFVDTDFGRSLLSLRRFLASESGTAQIAGYGDIAPCDVERWNRADLADWALSPFSGLTKKAAFKLDADVRADRSAARAQVCDRLREKSQLFAPMERVAAQLDEKGLTSLTAAVSRMTNRSEAWRAEQLAAVSAAARIGAAAELAGLASQAAFELLERAQVDVSRVVAPRGVDGAELPYCDVLITDQATAQALGRSACEVLVAADLTSAAYPAADPETPARALLEKLGVQRSDSALRRHRRAFYALEQVPTYELIFERCLNDAAAEPTYPCVVLEEFIDCYRADLMQTDDIDNAFSLPEALQAGMLLRGEETLCENRLLGASTQVAARIEVPCTGELTDAARSLVVLPRVLQGGEVLREPCLSPSQIESYLECPYKWFAQRRLRLDDLDEGFGPLEMGDFAHNVLHSFYKHFAEDLGLRKVTAENMGQARELMADVLERHKALQPHLRMSENRLIPTSEVERRELAELERKLMAYLDYEAQLLPTFAPTYLEYDVACGGAVTYAGQKLLGTADRVDVDDDGRFVVIDYKGSLSDSYALATREQGHLGKVQALIYAQVVRRTLGLEPVGALYVCYGRRKFATGAYDGRVLENAHLPNMKHKDCMCADRPFADVLDETEEVVAAALERMLAGDIAPRPATPEACKWCPVSSCSKRKG